jgi:integrase
LRENGFSEEEADLYQKGYKNNSFNIYRRGYTLFAETIDKIGIKVRELNSYLKMVTTMRKVLIDVAKTTTSKSLTDNMITAMSAISNKIFGRPLSTDRSVMDLVKALELQYPKEVKHREREVPKLGPVFEVIRKYGDNSTMPLERLQAKVLVLLLIFRAVRFSEALTIDRSSWIWREPEGRGTFTLQRKREVRASTLDVFSINQDGLGLPQALNALIKRTESTTVASEKSLFLSREGRKLSYLDIREMVKKVLVEAGQPKSRPYQLKAAGLSLLWKSGTRIQDIAAQAGHSFKTTTTLDHYISFDGGRNNMQIIADKGEEDGGNKDPN